MKQRLKITFILLPTAVIWGFAFVAQVLGSDHVGAFTFNGIRYLLGAAVLFPFLFFFEKEKELSRAWRAYRHRSTATVSLLAGGVMFVAAVFQQLGTTMTRDPAKAGFITGLYTAFTPVLYFLIFRHRIRWNIWVGCAMATLGLYLICRRDGAGGTFGLGEIFLLLGSLFWALHILIIDRFIDRVSPLRFAVGQFFVCGVLGMTAGLIFEEVCWADLWAARWALLYCGILSVGVAYTLQIFGQRDAEPTHAAIIFSTESVFAAVGGILWNLITPAHLHVDQQILPLGVAGAVIIFGGIVLSQLQFRTHQKSGRDHKS